jgi:hypothetical protein
VKDAQDTDITMRSRLHPALWPGKLSEPGRASTDSSHDNVTLPRSDRSFHCLERWIGSDRLAHTGQSQSLWISITQFLPEMRKLVHKLPGSDRDRDSSPSNGDFRPVKIVSPFPCFVGHAPQITGDGAHRIPGLPESLQLRVMAVTLGCSEQDLLCE